VGATGDRRQFQATEGWRCSAAHHQASSVKRRSGHEALAKAPFSASVGISSLPDRHESEVATARRDGPHQAMSSAGDVLSTST
jgi:hypothetical protein